MTINERYKEKTFAQAALAISKRHSGSDSISMNSANLSHLLLAKANQVKKLEDGGPIYDYAKPIKDLNGMLPVLQSPWNPAYTNSEGNYPHAMYRTEANDNFVNLMAMKPDINTSPPVVTTSNISDPFFFNQVANNTSLSKKTSTASEPGSGTVDYNDVEPGFINLMANKTKPSITKNLRFNSALADPSFTLPTGDPYNEEVDNLFKWIYPEGTVTKLESGPMLSNQNTSAVSPVSKVKKDPYLPDYATPALIGAGIETAINLGITMSKSEDTSPVTNPYDTEVRSLLRNMNYDSAAADSAATRAYQAQAENVKQLRSTPLRQSILANMSGRLAQQYSDNAVQAQSMNNQVAMQKINVLAQQGAARVNAVNLSRELAAKERAAKEQGAMAIGRTATNIGQSITNYKAGERQSDIIGSLLRTSNISVNKTSSIANGGDVLSLNDIDQALMKLGLDEERRRKALEALNR